MAHWRKWTLAIVAFATPHPRFFAASMKSKGANVDDA
eukprot:CAMPEP_0172658152 /NCGR_PEP_ID=MMETSP1074-20121228/2594_1 /TAXON_ID=2916 /ORGANISM="Ceratium fusus, Strain PA161109" /LENGTH=36 /DNA_ID= /DNA_START= /DNA_END= /DNA_ORIENTATION=